MLREEEVSSCIQGLIGLGVLEPVFKESDRGELFKLKIPPVRLIGRILGGEFGEPPEGIELVPWFSCVMLKILLKEAGASISKDKFIAMAAVVTGFMSDAAIHRRLHSHYDSPVISRRRAGEAGKQPRSKG